MGNMTATDVNLSGPILSDAQFRDELLTFGGAGTVKAGTILARDSSTKKLIPFVKGGVVNENGIPKAIVAYEVTATGAGDVAIRAGVFGQYRKHLLVIHADGNASNIDGPVMDQLRDFGMTPVDVSELNIPDNQ